MLNIFKIFSLVAAGLFLYGCTSTDTSDNLGLETDPDAQSAVAVVQGKCPLISFREGTTYYRQYARRGEGDPSQITYQASLADATRSCTINDDQLTVNVFAAGRVLAGPKGKAGTLELPIRVAVLDRTTNEVLYSELSKQVITLTEPNLTGQFVFNDPGIVIPVGAAGETQIFVGFDEGPKR